MCLLSASMYVCLCVTDMCVCGAYMCVHVCVCVCHRLEYGGQAGNPTDTPEPDDFNALVADIEAQK